MNFLTKGLEYNRLAKAFGNAYSALNEYEIKFNSGFVNDYYEFKQDLLILAYLCRKEILNRMEEYGWIMASPISVPKISRGKITLLFAYQHTIGRLTKFANKIKIGEELQEILDKKTEYDVIRKLTPSTIKFNTALLGRAMMRYRYKLTISMMLKDSGKIMKETLSFIVVQNSNIILSITRDHNNLNVRITSLNIIGKSYKKEWDFNQDAEDNEILTKIFTSFL